MIFMRLLTYFLLLGILGCSPTITPSVAPAATSSEPEASQDTYAPASEAAPIRTVAHKPTQVPDLRTRKFGDDWPAFLGPTGDSKSTEQGILTDWPAAGPSIVWQKKIAAGYCIPSISRGRLFLFDRVGDDARLRCLKSETGEDLWEFTYPTDYTDMYDFNNGPRCCPVVDDDRVYLYGAEGTIHCLRVADGEVVWKLDTAERFGVVQNFFGVGSTPVIDGDLLIAHVGGSPEGSPKVQSGRTEPNGTAVVAMNKFTGEVKYAVGDELASYASPVLATIGDRRWLFMMARGGLLALEPQSGKVDFHYPWRATILESVNAANPVVVDDKVLISESYSLRLGSSLLRVQPGEFDVTWKDEPAARQQSMRAHFVTPVHVDGYVYGCSGRRSSNAELRCIDLATGKVQWSEPRLNWTSLLYVDGHFVCLSEEGTLRLIRANPEKFDLVATATLRGDDGQPLLTRPAWAAPILSHGLLYVRGDDRLVCLELIPSNE